MRKSLFFVLYLGMILNCPGQTPGSDAIIETNGLVGSLDGKIVSGTINLLPGKHTAILIDSASRFLTAIDKIKDGIVKNGYSRRLDEIFRYVNFTAEKGKVYVVNISKASFCDTLARSIYFNHSLPQVVDKETSERVCTYEKIKMFNPVSDVCGAVNMNYSFDKPGKGQTAIIRILSLVKREYLSFKIRGLTDDNYYISFTLNPGDSTFFKSNPAWNPGSENCKDIFLYLKPGHYWLDYIYRSYNIDMGRTGSYVNTSSVILSNSFYFLAEEGRNTTVNLSRTETDKGFKAMRSVEMSTIFFLPDGRHGWIAGDEGSLMATVNGGKTWKLTRNGKKYDASAGLRPRTYQNSIDVCFADSLNGWIIGNQGSISHTSDGGITWSFQKPNSPSNSIYGGNIRFFNQKFGFVTNSSISSNGAKLFSTLNSGEKWMVLAEERFSAMFYPFSIDNIWKATNKEILHSTDMGKTWILVTDQKRKPGILDNTPLFENLLFFVDPLHGWLLQDGLHCTIDGGKTWTKQNLNISPGEAGQPDLVYFIDKEHGWACVQSCIIFKTTDGGNNWTMLNINDEVKDIKRMYFKDENNGWAIGGAGFIYNTSDGGQRWTVMNILDLIE